MTETRSQFIKNPPILHSHHTLHPKGSNSPPGAQKMLGKTPCSCRNQKGNTDLNHTAHRANSPACSLRSKVPGGTISVGRRFHGDMWRFEHERHNFALKRETIYVSTGGGGTATGSVLSIDKGGVDYERQLTSPLVLVHDSYRITQTGPETAPTGYRWEDKNGAWKEYETTGETSARVTSYGTKNGVLGKVLYESGENGRALGIFDRNNRQVIWFEYGPDGKLSAARDLANRRVEYRYTEGRLSSVKDVLTHATSGTLVPTVH